MEHYISLEKAVYLRKRAVYLRKRSLHLSKGALSHHKRALYLPPKSPTSSAKEPNIFRQRA